MQRSPEKSPQPTPQPTQRQATQQEPSSSHLSPPNPLSGQPSALPQMPRSNSQERAPANHLTHGMTADERDALDRFTGPAYRDLNRTLRSGDKLSDEQWKEVQLLESALEKLPKCKGFSSRVLKFDDQEARAAFLADFGTALTHRQYVELDFKGELEKKAKNPPADAKEYVTPQFMSCKAGAMDQGLASFSSLEQADVELRLKVLCTEKHAGDLRELYVGRDFGEQEVLFPPGTKFHVIAVSESNLVLAEMDAPREPLGPSRKP